MFKLGAMSFCLANLVQADKASGEQILKAAADIGVEGVEFYQNEWGATPEDVKEAPALRGLAESLGIEIFGLGSGVRLGYHDERRLAAVETLKNQVRAAAAVGAGVVTFPAIDSQPVPSGRAATEGGLPFVRGVGPLIEQTQEVAEFAAELGVKLAILNHCYFVSSAWHQEWVVRLVGMGNVGVCLDPGNYLFYESEDPVTATRQLAGSILSVRLGDWQRHPDQAVVEAFSKEQRLQIYGGAIFGEGEVDHGACLALLRDSGYTGYLSLKSAGSSAQGPAAAIKKTLENIRGLLGELDEA